MSNDTARQWLVKIADAVERWPMMPKDDIDVWMVTETPTGVLVYLVNRHIHTEDERRAVIKVVPVLTTDNFAEAARQIRERAETLR